jgi:trans-aconitate 2-methyltransferase
MPPHDWDAAAYDRVADGVKALGHEVLARLNLAGDETVLDAGCGPGEVTAALVARLPRGRVIGVDASPRMVAAARERLGSTAEVIESDLAELHLAEPVDAILSTATFHWVPDHARLFARLRGNLRPGGRLVAQCGGAGNIEAVRAAAERAMAEAPFAAYLGGWRGPWTFATPQETEAELSRAGFAHVRCWLSHEVMHSPHPRTYARTVLLGAHLDRLPAALHEPFVDAVLERLEGAEGSLTIAYVRLNIEATAGA